MKSIRKQNNATGTPWLFLATEPFEDEKDDDALSFLSMSDNNRLFKLPLLPMKDFKVVCIGSSHGWLICMDSCCNMNLLNPISGRRIPLPPISELPVIDFTKPQKMHVNLNFLHNNEYFNFLHSRQYGYDSIIAKIWQSKKQDDNIGKVCLNKTRKVWLNRSWYLFRFTKAVLSAPPVMSTVVDGSWEFTVIMILNENWGHRVCFTKAGDKSWTLLQGSKGSIDIIMHSSDNVFYTLDYSYDYFAVKAWEPSGTTFEPKLVPPNSNQTDRRILPGHLRGLPGYLVETTSGELLVVLIWNTGLNVRLFSWDKEGKWKNVESLGEQVVFLGNNQSICLQASACPELRPNTIYYINGTLMKMLKLCADVETVKCEMLLSPILLDSLEFIQQLRYSCQSRYFQPIWFSPTMDEDEVVIPKYHTDETIDEVGFIWKTGYQ